jgi:chorismate mutase / prephenate dehydratase
MDINEIFQRMKRLDYEMIKILNQRMELSLRTTRLPIRRLTDKDESEFFDHIRKIPERLVAHEFSDKILADIMQESRRVQERTKPLVGFAGEHGANSEMAVYAYDKEVVPIPCMKFIDVFEGVKNGRFNFGLVPVENSLEGGVTEVNDLLIRENLHIVGEVKLRIHHTYMTLPEVDPKGIRVVYSHPQALAQCREFIAQHRLEDLPFYNTAGAARMLSETRPKASAVIANKMCADIYDLKIIAENIEDSQGNFTRFLLLSDKVNRQQGNKCSMVFITRNECGALNRVLSILEHGGINMSRIESRPSRIHPGNFAFLVDFNGSPDKPNIARALKAINKETIMYKLLGCYNESAPINGD